MVADMLDRTPQFNYIIFGWIGPDGGIVADPSFKPGLPTPAELQAWSDWQDGEGTLWRLRFASGRYEAAVYTSPSRFSAIDVDPQTSRWLIDLLRPYGSTWDAVRREAERLAALKP